MQRLDLGGRLQLHLLALLLLSGLLDLHNYGCGGSRINMWTTADLKCVCVWNFVRGEFLKFHRVL